GLVLDQQHALPQQVDVPVLAVDLLDPLLEAGYPPAGYPEHLEECVPERLGLGILRRLVRPLARERAGTILDFVPAQRHGFLPFPEHTARRRNWHPGAGSNDTRAWSLVLGGMARPATVIAAVALTVGFL